MRRYAEMLAGISCLLVVLFLAGCRSLPQVAVQADPVDFLPPEENCYFRIDSSADKSVLMALLEKCVPEMAESDRIRLADCVTTVYASSGTDGRNMCIVASGAFPALKGLVFTEKNGWKSHEYTMATPIRFSCTVYTHNSGMEVAFPNNSLAFFSTESINPMLERLEQCIIEDGLEHNTVLSDGGSAEIAFCLKSVSAPKGIESSVINTLTGNIASLSGTVCSYAAADEPVYSVTAFIQLKSSRLVKPMRIIVSTILMAGVLNTSMSETDMSSVDIVEKDSGLELNGLLMTQSALLSYFFGG